MKLIFSALWNLRHCSIMFHSMKMCSTYECPCWKHDCSSLIFESTTVESLLRRTTQNTLPGTDRSVISLQFWHSARFPFLGILVMLPFHHLSRTASICKNIFKRFVNSTTTVSSQHFCSSDMVWSRLTALLFSELLLHPTSLIVISPRFWVSSSGESSMLKLWVTVGSGWFRASLKCSIKYRSSSFIWSSVFFTCHFCRHSMFLWVGWLALCPTFLLCHLDFILAIAANFLLGFTLFLTYPMLKLKALSCWKFIVEMWCHFNYCSVDHVVPKPHIYVQVILDNLNIHIGNKQVFLDKFSVLELFISQIHNMTI